MQNIRMLKIKIKGKFVTLQWEQYQETTSNWDNHTLMCADPPRPELYTCMQKMAPHIVQICELPEDDANKIEARSVSLSYGEDGSGVVISGIKELESNVSPMCLNTPYKPENAPEGMEECAMSCALQDDIEKLCEEAFRYINGDRAQQNLFTDQEGEGEDKHEPEES